MDDRGRELLGMGYEMGPVSVTEENIRQFTDAVGETNPLFLEPGIACNGPYRGLVAPPTFCFFCYPPMDRLEHRFPEPGVFLGSICCEFFKAIRPGDVFQGQGRIADIFEKTGRGGKMIFTVHELLYANQQGEKMAEVQMTWIRRLDLDEGEKLGGREPRADRNVAPLPPLSILNVMERKLSFENVDVGDPITPLIKEVNSDIVRGYVRMMNWEEWNFSIFTDDDSARKMGLDGAISPGELNLGFISQAITDWAIGGILQSLETNFRGVVRHGDRLECGGIVTEKFVGKNGSCVVCDLFAENQEGERPVVGKATILLP